MARRIATDEITGLALEGGGGKGNAFVGSLLALEALQVIRPVEVAGGRVRRQDRITRIGGASAGALTATMLATGMSGRELRELLTRTKFTAWFDRRSMSSWVADPIPGTPVPGTILGSLSTALDLAATLAELNRAPLPPPLSTMLSPTRAMLDLLRTWLAGLLDADARMVAARAGLVLEADGAALARSVADVIDDSLGPYLGLFAGEAPFVWLRDTMLERANRLGGPSYTSASYPHGLSFHEFEEIFGVDLILTGSNLTTTKSEVFSAATTPGLPVPVAARISMGLPLFYTPVVITGSTARRWGTGGRTGPDALAGYWVDGGLFDNLPLTAVGPADSTLGLRLDESGRRPIRSGDDLLKAIIALSIGSGEARASATRFVDVDPFVLLDSSDFGLLSFKPRPAALREATRKSWVRTHEYFGIEPPSRVPGDA